MGWKSGLNIIVQAELQLIRKGRQKLLKEKIDVNQEKETAEKIANKLLADKEFYENCHHVMRDRVRFVQEKANSKFYVNKTPLGFEENAKPILSSFYIILQAHNPRMQNKKIKVETIHHSFLHKIGADKYVIVPHKMQKVLIPILPEILGKLHIDNLKRWCKHDFSRNLLLNKELADRLAKPFVQEFNDNAILTAKTDAGLRID